MYTTALLRRAAAFDDVAPPGEQTPAAALARALGAPDAPYARQCHGG